MRKISILLFAVSSMWATDYSSLSTEELVNMKDSISVEKKAEFRNEMRKRLGSMSMAERQALKKERTSAAFSNFDKNSDSFIDQAEFDEARNARKAKRAAEGKKNRHTGEQKNIFKKVDANKDGKVSQEELSAHRDKRMKRNRDNRGGGRK